VGNETWKNICKGRDPRLRPPVKEEKRHSGANSFKPGRGEKFASLIIGKAPLPADIRRNEKATRPCRGGKNSLLERKKGESQGGTITDQKKKCLAAGQRVSERERGMFTRRSRDGKREKGSHFLASPPTYCPDTKRTKIAECRKKEEGDVLKKRRWESLEGGRIKREDHIAENAGICIGD